LASNLATKRTAADRPFVGPAGRLFDRALVDAGIDRALEAELGAIQSSILVCLGATAAQPVFGSAWRVTKERGRFSALPRPKTERSHIEAS